MKRYISLFILTLVITVTGYGQTDQQVSFIPGLGESTNIWNTMAGQLRNDFVFNRDNVPYETGNAISNSASTVFIPRGTVGIGHSLGGILAREYLRQRSTDRMKALITVGSPNLGAPVAKNVQNGRIANAVAGWVEDLLAGPATSLGSIRGRNFAKRIIANLGIISLVGGRALDTILNSRYGNIPSVDDLIPGSQFITRLNSSPNNTLPSAHFAIFGAEDSYEYVRLAESALRGPDDPLERGTGIRIHRKVSALYFVFTAYYSFLSSFYFYKYYSSNSYDDPFYFTYYDRAVFFASVARQWARGFVSLVYYQQRDWDRLVTGVKYYYYNGKVFKDANDGLLPATSQAPGFFDIFNDQALRANGANHLEETVHPNVKRRIEQVFRNPEVNIEEVEQDPIDPLPLPDPGSYDCYDNYGNPKPCLSGIN